jgi:hypothetical protein
MSCNLTQGFPLACKDSVGGIKTLFLLEQSNVATFTASGQTVISLTLNAGKIFWEYDLRKATSEMTSAITTSEANGSTFYKTDIKFVMYKMDANKWGELQSLAQQLVVAIVRDNNNNYWFVGYVNGGNLLTSQGKTGKAFGDLNGFDLSLEFEEPNPLYLVPASLIPALI